MSRFSQILYFNSSYVKYNKFAFLVINLMVENSEDYNIKNHITSLDSQLIADDQSDVGVSVNTAWKSSPLVEINQQPETDNYAKLANERYFLICQSCLWCASYFKNETTVTKCPLCHKGKVDCMPIGNEERYSFNHNSTRSAELIFSNNFRSWLDIEYRLHGIVAAY